MVTYKICAYVTYKISVYAEAPCERKNCAGMAPLATSVATLRGRNAGLPPDLVHYDAGWMWQLPETLYPLPPYIRGTDSPMVCVLVIQSIVCARIRKEWVSGKLFSTKTIYSVNRQER